ncbi:MAG TPA: DNA mismatch repair endonuclease MutL [Bacillota bacterium]
MPVEPRIRVLPPEAANRIAAGEVVERPASVVKELVENSLDAGARRIVIRVEEGGRRRIQVADDGHGMNPDEVRLALLRHATSKIRGMEDLARLRTLGFRGEALPSIAAVARLEIVTRVAGSDFAWRLRAEGGRVIGEGRTAAPPGTTVTVDQLFFNTPARRKHLRRPGTELARIAEVVHGLALAHPQTRFRLEHGTRVLLQTTGDGDVAAVAAAVWGAEAARRLVFGEEQRPEASAPFRRLAVYAGLPDAARAGRQFQFFVVNGRAVRSDRLRAALERPYRRLLPLHRYPVAVVRLELDPSAVDANVHPSKHEVRLDREREIADALTALVHRLLSGADLAPRIALSGGAGPGAPRPPAAEPAMTAMPACSSGTTGPAAVGSDTAAGGPDRPGVQEAAGHVAAPVPGSPGESVAARERPAPYGGDPARPRFADLRILGQVERTYLIAEGPQGLYILDQHAAHERVVFEQLLGRAAGGPAPRQTLAVPLAVDLDPATVERWRRHRRRLEGFGFATAEFGPRSIVVREVPLLYRRPAGVAELLDLLDALGDDESVDPAALESDLAQRTTAACRAAVKAHDPLQPGEAQHLLELLDGCRDPYTCPHGRPTLLVMRWGELERHFKRTM